MIFNAVARMPKLLIRITVLEIEQSTFDQTIHLSVIPGPGPEIAVSVLGAGPVMILLHGIASSSRSWLPVLAALAGSYRLILPDLRGHGASGHPEEGYGLTDYADDLERIVAYSGSTDPIIVGHSLGGLIAMCWARRHPAAARAIVLEDIPMTGGEERIPMLESWAELAALPIPEVIAHYEREYPMWSDEDRAARAAAITSTHQEVFCAMIDQARGADGVENLADLECIGSPVLLIYGDVETGGLVPADAAERLACTGSNFNAVRIPGGSHSLHRDSTVQFLNALLLFVEKP
jgi:pimeloyl-ACP methyl ester carboxylesterase